MDPKSEPISDMDMPDKDTPDMNLPDMGDAGRDLTKAKIIQVHEMIQHYYQSTFRTEQFAMIGAFATASFLIVNSDDIPDGPLTWLVAILPIFILLFSMARIRTLGHLIGQLMELEERYTKIGFPEAPTARSALGKAYKASTKSIGLWSDVMSVLSLVLACVFAVIFILLT